MLSRHVRRLGAAVVLLCASAAPAAAQPTSRLGWMAELAGACWQGRNAAGTVVDRQCFQVQFAVFLRASIQRGADFRGDTVFGYSRDRSRLEMYAWTNQGEPSIFAPTYRDGVYAFEGARENGAPTRAIWRRTPTGFEIAEQTQNGGAWSDAEVVAYTRQGAAPAPYLAGRAPYTTGAGFGWLDRIAGRCYRQVEPERVAANRGCFAFQYRNVLRQTWYSGADATGEAVMFTRPLNAGIQFFHWDARGNFGVGGSSWSGRNLISTTDTADDMRRILRRRGNGFLIVTERRSDDPSLQWEYTHHFRFTSE